MTVRAATAWPRDDGVARVATAPCMRLQGLSLRAGALLRGRVLFDRLDALIEPGQSWVVLGPNGAGKSTLLAALAGLVAPSAGSIELNGRPLATWPLRELSRQRAWCPQFWLDPFAARVDETVRLARPAAAWWARDADADEDTERITRLLQRLDIAHLAAADVRTLSGGERQRVAIATALWQETPWLMLDEPASHLDLQHQQLLVQVLRAHAAAGGAVLASLHDLNLAWSLATHAVLLDGRGGAFSGPRDTVMAPEHLSAAFGVPVSRVEVCGVQRFWVGAAAGEGGAS